MKFCDELPKATDEVEKLLTRNRIFIDRTEGIGEISSSDAIAYGLTGPNLRATGVDLDLRDVTLGMKNMTLMFPLA